MQRLRPFLSESAEEGAQAAAQSSPLATKGRGGRKWIGLIAEPEGGPGEAGRE